MNPADGAANAPVTRQIERRGGKSVPFTRGFPTVRGGLCDACGVLDRNQPSIFQYKLCPHFRGMTLECTYCDSTKDQGEVVGRSILSIHEHPYEKDSYGNPTLVVVCDSYECSTRHRKRFEISA